MSGDASGGGDRSSNGRASTKSGKSVGEKSNEVINPQATPEVSGHVLQQAAIMTTFPALAAEQFEGVGGERWLESSLNAVSMANWRALL